MRTVRPPQRAHSTASSQLLKSAVWPGGGASWVGACASPDAYACASRGLLDDLREPVKPLQPRADASKAKGASMHLRPRPTFSVVTSSASSSTRMCFFIPVSDTRKGRASSLIQSLSVRGRAAKR